jgi:hypothetical protein
VDNLQAAVLSSALAFVAAIVAAGFVWLAPNVAAPAVTVNLMIRPPTPSPGATAAVPVAVGPFERFSNWQPREVSQRNLLAEAPPPGS